MNKTSAAAAIREESAGSLAFNVDEDHENNQHASAMEVNDRDELLCRRDCGEAFSEEVAYSEHRLQHPPQSTHLHSHSDGLLDSEKDNKTRYFCTFCSLSFVKMSELHLHMKDHSQISLKGSDVNPGATKPHAYTCGDCGKSYSVIGHFLNHQRSHRLPSKSVFHDLEHLKKKSFQCESCGRNYSRASALDAHRRCHEEKLVKSKSKGTKEKVQTAKPAADAKLSQSPTVEDCEKLFKCVCGKAFSSAMRLKTHQRFSRNTICAPEESKQKPKKGCDEFYCSECNKAFSGHIALFNHQRWHANHTDGTATRFPCEQCGKVFMTLAFYYRHQRTAHSDETPSKSFHHQVGQLQKKAFECEDCGLKFSRASALQSHQLQHTDVFREAEKACSEPSLPAQGPSESEQKDKNPLEASVEGTVKPEPFSPANVGGEQRINDTDEGTQSYEPGDFNVQVISASESEDESVQEPNPDLELLCESDQDLREDGEVSAGSLVSKLEMDLKIVQIDFEQSSQCPSSENAAQDQTTEERFDCPECYRWFNDPLSLEEHRMWHSVRRRPQNPGQSEADDDCDTFSDKIQTQSSVLLSQAEPGLEGKAFTCNECGQVFSQLSALVSHQLHHPKRKLYQCPHCMSSYLSKASLFNHLKTCTTQKGENISVGKKEYNPKKTLLGPKNYHCEQCGKGFWSLGAYSHHKQNQMECVDLRLRKGMLGSLPSHGRSRSGIKVACPVCGRKFRHKGILALHMRKHENGNHKCELCGRSFRLFSSLLRHEVVHSDQLLPPPAKSFQHQVEQLKKNTYACPDCGKLFSRAKALQFHMKSHGYETSRSPSLTGTVEALNDLQCATCFANFSKKSSLRTHQKLCVYRYDDGGVKTERSEKHATKIESINANMPEPSMQINEDSDALKMEKHIKESGSGSNKCKYKCKICGESFMVVEALNFHRRTHAEGNKAMSKSNSAISLMFEITKKKGQSKGPIHCSYCGMRFATKAALGSHKRSHRNQKSLPLSLREEVLSSVVHKTDDGGFGCEKCGKHFFTCLLLQRHWSLNPQCLLKPDPEPNTDLERDGSVEQFSCSKCNQMFSRISLLASHYQNEHLQSLEEGESLLASKVSLTGTESLSSVFKMKTYRCPLCSMTFEKARGLRAHRWQAHSEIKKSKTQPLLGEKVEQRALKKEVEWTKHAATIPKVPKEVKPDPQPVRSVQSPDSGKQSASPEDPLPLSEVGSEGKQKIETGESAEQAPPPLCRPPEYTVKYLFKCDKCGKAFQTEEQLDSHKIKAKSRPHCCALCCHGFWTESQLQQHLAWHDQVRCRLPNEVRLWLSSAVTSKPFKAHFPTEIKGRLLPLSAASEPSLDPAEKPGRSHTCEHCSKAFHSPAVLQKHRAHCSSMAYHCSVCPRVFSRIQEYFDHHQECIRRLTESTAPSSGDPSSLNLP